MNLDAFLRNSSPSPTSCIYMQEAKVELWDEVLIDWNSFILSWSLITGNSSDKVLKDPLPQAVFSWKRAIMNDLPSRVSSPSQKERDNLGFWSSYCTCVAIICLVWIKYLIHSSQAFISL
jgi:hypothetical protein